MASIEFLNIDLDLESEDDISLIINELGNNVVVMNNVNFNGIHKVSLELAGLMGDSDYLFQQYFTLIDNLSIDSKMLWNHCIKKQFDLGFESGMTPNALQEKLPENIINKLSELDASLAITIYALSEDENNL